MRPDTPDRPARVEPGALSSTQSARVDAARVAGLPRRFLAGVVDAALVLAGIALFAFSFKTFPFSPEGFEELPSWNSFDLAVDLLNAHLPDIVALLVPFLAGLFLLGFLSESFWGTSLGLVVVGLRLVDTQGRSPSMPRLFLRNLGRVLEVLLLGIGMLLAWVFPSRRSLHDLLSGTLVVRR